VILPGEIVELNIELESLPKAMVSGRVLASDTGEGLAGVDITITGFMDYNLETDADGSFSVLAYAGYTYDFELRQNRPMIATQRHDRGRPHGTPISAR